MEPTCFKESRVWQWISCALFIICVIELLVILKQKKNNLKSNESVDKHQKKELTDKPIDFTDVMNSAFLSADLYDKMKVKCHPDRFASDPTRRDIADSLFQRITQNKVNYKALVELKREAEELLNITI